MRIMVIRCSVSIPIKEFCLFSVFYDISKICERNPDTSSLTPISESWKNPKNPENWILGTSGSYIFEKKNLDLVHGASVCFGKNPWAFKIIVKLSLIVYQIQISLGICWSFVFLKTMVSDGLKKVFLILPEMKLPDVPKRAWIFWHISHWFVSCDV